MSKAFVDTTILADALLKPGEIAAATKAALGRYTTTELPVYAIKEFKAGVLKNYIWFYNKLAIHKSLHKAVGALQGMSRTPKKYTTSTALEAFKAAAYLVRNLSSAEMVDKYGDSAKVDTVMCDRYRLALRKCIEMAWRRRRKITTQIVIPLSCYNEVPPYEEDGVLKYDPVECDPQQECCLATALKKRPDDLKKLKKIVDAQPSKLENQRRSQVLNDLVRNPKRPMTQKMCKDLGDAFFALFAPDDAIILTTNTSDHEPLAKVLGKNVERP